MDEELITFVIDGGDARNGNVSATVFASKLTAFLSAIYGLERAFANTTKRQIDLEVVSLQRRSPARVIMRARSKAQGYDSAAALRWSVGQLERIRNGEAADRRIPEGVLATVVSLADYRADKASEISMMRVELGSTKVPLDRVLAGHAMVARETATEARAMPWKPGVSRGSIFGELRGVMDLDGAREFFICPPSGPAQIRCVFGEGLRDRMVANLFKVVRANGLLHYDGRSAHPFLVEADELEGQLAPTAHLLDLAGAFPGLDFEPFEGVLA